MESQKVENRYPRKNKSIRYNSAGITLVALVVTIIVLIILAGISINLILGENGIITKAREASKAQEITEIKENLQMEIVSKEMQKIQNGQVITQSEIESIIKAKYGEESVIRNEDETIKSVKPEGKDYEIPFKDIYNETISAKISPSELKVGDYIKYNTGITNVGENGVITCRVLYNDDTYGLQIISDKVIGEEIELGGTDWETTKEAYNNAIEDLNDEAEKYLNTIYAIDARCVGSIPTVDSNGNFAQKDSVTQETVSIPSDWTLPSGWTTRDTGCYKLDENYKTDQTRMKEIEIWEIGQRYWVASHDTNKDTCYYFRVRVMHASNTFGYHYLNYVKNVGTVHGRFAKAGLRPCFSLKSDIKITGGDGTSADTAYTM